jgi:hypothetical protein
MRTVDRIFEAIDRLGGVARTREIAAQGIDMDAFYIAVYYGKVLRVRKGIWARPGLDPVVLEAQRAGGRLACVSALAYHGVIADVDGPVHISAPWDVTRWRPGRHREPAVRHWSRRPLPGDRFAVTPEAAWSQFALCRAVSSRDLRLRAPEQGDSL